MNLLFPFNLWESNRLIITSLCLSLHHVISKSTGKNTLCGPIPVLIMYIFIIRQLYFHLLMQVKHIKANPYSMVTCGHCSFPCILGRASHLQEWGCADCGCHLAENTNVNDSTVRQDLTPKCHFFPSALGFVCYIYCSNVFFMVQVTALVKPAAHP